MAWTPVDVDTSSLQPGDVLYQQNRITKATGGIWAVYVGSDNKIYARLSTDGLAWGSAETVWTPTTPSTPANWNVGIIRAQNGDPVIYAHVQDSAGIRLRFFRRESGVWNQKTTVTPTDAPGPGRRMFLFNSYVTQDTWIVLWVDTVAAVIVGRYAVSDDDMATWGFGPTTFATYAGSHATDRGSLWFCQHTDDEIFGMVVYKGAAEEMWEVILTSWTDGTALVTSTNRDAKFDGPFSVGQGPRAISLHRYADGDIVCAYWQYTSGIINHKLKVNTRIGSTWNTGPNSSTYIIAEIPDSRIFGTGAAETAWKIYTDAGGTGTFAQKNIKSHSYSSSWSVTELLDEAINSDLMGVLDPSGGQNTAGDYVARFDQTADDFGIIYSDDVDLGLTQTFNKTCLSTWIFASLLVIQGFIIRVISSLTTTGVLGGRQTVIMADGTLWHAYKNGSSLKAAYSTDQGVTWTITDVGPIFSLSSIAMCAGSGDNPVIAISRTSNFDFYFYQWNGSSWIFKKRINVTTDDTESMAIVYDGTTYHLISGSLVTSTNDRRVRYRSSADLVTWSAAVNVKNGDSSGTGPQKNRRVAACMGPSNVLHMTYSVRSTGEHRLYYQTRTAGVFGTAVELHVGTSGNNIADYQSGLSIAVDSAGKAHIIARIRNSAYTSRVKLRYYRVSGATIEINEDVHDEVDGDQGMPSISLNGTTVVVVWASVGLGLNVARAQRDGAGNWTYDTITINTRNNLHSVHGPSYGTTYGYGRGVAGTMQGSEEWFQSNDAQSGTGASLENTWFFSGILSTQQRIMANVWQFVQDLVGVRSLTLTNTWIFHESRLNTERPAEMENTWHFHSVLGGTTADEWIQQTWHFASALQGIKDPTKSLADTWHFQSALTLTKSAGLATGWAFEQDLSSNIHRQKAVANTWNFASVLGLNFSLNKPLAHAWVFIQGLISMKADEGCEPDFTPERPLQTSEDDVAHVYFIGPLPTLDLSVQLLRPTYGNSRRQSLQVRINRTRSGGLKVHARTPTYEPQTMNFEGLTLLKNEQVRNFLRVTKGRKVYYIDEQNRKWEGYITTSDIDLSIEARDKGGAFTLDFEGRLVT